VWDSLGEAYLAKSNRVMARVCYQKSLELEPDNGNAIAQLQKLEAGASKP
jgi:cytochrome c-type biogenesis protein CcmH/NrfG